MAVRPFRYLVHEVDVRAGAVEGLELLSVSQYLGVIPRSDITDKEPRAKELSNYKRCWTGDIVLNRMSAYQGALGLARQDGVVSPDYAVLRVSSAMDPKYLAYLMKSDWFVGEMVLRLRGIGAPGIGTVRTPRVNIEDLGDIPIPLPTLADQACISRFLDDQTSRIDQITTARRQQDGLLSEWWEERLRRTLKRADDPHVPLRSVAWWQEGPGILAKDFRDEGVPILRIAHLRSTPPSLDGCQFVDAEEGVRRWGHFTTKVGDLMISGSASVGALAVWIDEAVEGAIPYTGLIRTGARQGKLLSAFLRFFFLSTDFMDQVDRLKQGIGIQHWGPTHLAQVRIPWPSLEEQSRRADEIARIEVGVADARAGLLRSIELLQEFKRSLISTAVSGEIDVSVASGRGVPA